MALEWQGQQLVDTTWRGFTKPSVELRQLGDLRRKHGHDVRLGCSTIAHERLGFCAWCPGSDQGAELMGWQLLALYDKRVTPRE